MSIRITGMNSNMDTDAMVKELVKAYEKKGQTKKNDKTKFEWKQEIWTGLNKKIKAFNSKVKNLQFVSNYNQKKTTSSDESKVSVIAGEKAVKGTQTIKVTSLAKTSYVTSKQLMIADENNTGAKVTSATKLTDLGITSGSSITLSQETGEPVTLNIDDNTTVDTLVQALSAANVDVSFDEGNGRLFISAKESGKANDMKFTGTGNAISVLGLTKETGGSVVAGSDASIVLNGATFTSSSNAFNINGMAINVKGLTGDQEITLTTDTDTDAIYNNIKDVIKEYSKLINELSKLYNAENAKGYEPLSDDEKDAMSDTEIEKWETKIKDSLLRRDSSVNDVISAMKNASMASYIVDDKEYTLSDFGIGTLNYFTSGDFEKSALHINGDEDDDEVSGKTNTLKQMIMGDPDTVAKFFAKYMSKISDGFNKLTTSTTNRSYGNFYDDKKFKTDLTSYEKKITDWEKYVADIEDKYYSQFTRMEKTLAKLNSTQTSLSSYFGG